MECRASNDSELACELCGVKLNVLHAISVFLSPVEFHSVVGWSSGFTCGIRT